MRNRFWVLLMLALLSLSIALVIGLWPVHVTITIGGTENGPGGTPTVSCGSPLFKQRATFSAPFTGIRYDGNDPCSLTRDHRRLPVKILGGAGLVLLASWAGDAFLTRRRAAATLP